LERFRLKQVARQSFAERNLSLFFRNALLLAFIESFLDSEGQCRYRLLL
jgi:hypothetical protein